MKGDEMIRRLGECVYRWAPDCIAIPVMVGLDLLANEIVGFRYGVPQFNASWPYCLVIIL